jgi:hypothetical protein
MKEHNSTSNSDRSKISLGIISEELINDFLIKQDRILDLLSNRKPTLLNGFVTEKQAIELVKKKATWFWQMRKLGNLNFKKIGNTIYYSTEDLNSLLRK